MKTDIEKLDALMKGKNYQFHVEIKMGQQQEMLNELWAVCDKYKDCHMGWTSSISEYKEFFQEQLDFIEQNKGVALDE